jgi:hypothetical protein
LSILVGVIEWAGGLLSIFPKLVYFLTTAFVSLLDVFQFAVRKIAGLDAYYLANSDVPQTGDIALGFIRGIFSKDSQFPALQNAFWALVILGVILLVVSTFIATIRSEYSGGDNNKYKIITSAVKSIFLFFIVPASIIFGLMLGDIFLLALDRATSTNAGASTLFGNNEIYEQVIDGKNVQGKLQAATIAGTDTVTYTYYDIFGSAIPSNTQTISGLVFQTAAFNANRARQGQKLDDELFHKLVIEGKLSNFGIFTDGTQEEVAQMIDEAFVANVVFSADNGDRALVLGPMKHLAGTGPFSLNNNVKITNMSKFNVALVWYFYDLWQYNYVIAFAFLIVVMKIMVNVVVGLMKRLIEMILLFMVSPPIVAIMPMDNGKAFEKWRESFLARAVSVFAVIVGFNLFFLILPYIQQIKFLDPKIIPFKFINLLISTIFVIVGLQSIESIIAILSKVVGGDDVNKSGGELIGKAQDNLSRAATFAATAAGVPVSMLKGVGNLAGKGVMAAGRGAKNVASALDDKYAGGYGKEVLKNAGHKLRQAKDNALLMGKGKELGKIGKDAEDEWTGGLGNSKYDEQMKSSDVYNDFLKNKYRNRKRGASAPSFEDWSKSAGVQRDAEKHFAKSFGQTRDEYINDKSQDSERSNHIDGKVLNARKNMLTSRKQSIANAKQTTKKRISKVGGYIKKGAVGFYKQSGLKNIVKSSLMLGENVKDATIRGGKGGFKAMQLGFGSASAKDIAQAKKAKDFKKEEDLRVAARKQLEQEAKAKKK